MLQKLRAAYVAVRLDGAGLTLAALGLAALVAAGAVVLVPLVGLAWALVAAGLVLLGLGGLLLWWPRHRLARARAGAASQAADQPAGDAASDVTAQARRWASDHPVETLVIGAALGGLLIASPKARQLVRDGVSVAAATSRLHAQARPDTPDQAN